MARFALPAILGFAALLLGDEAFASRNYNYARNRTRTAKPAPARVVPKYQFNPLAGGSTRDNRLKPPAPIQFQKPKWVDPGDYYRAPVYGAGTNKSGPNGQGNRTIKPGYLGPNTGVGTGVTGPRQNLSAPNGGAGRQKKGFGYDEKRSKTE